MSDINDIDVRLMDGTLLLVFLGMMRHRKATRVAADLGLTQPAVSHALKRLRLLYDDPLFVRQSHGMEPTALSRELEPRLHAAVQNLSASMQAPAAFDPATSDASLRIAGLDYELAGLIPRMIAGAVRSGASVAITSRLLSGAQTLEALREAEVDLGVGIFETLPARGVAGPFEMRNLYSEEYVVIARKGHPFEATAQDIDAYAEAPHLLVTPSGVSKGLVDFALDQRGAARNVQAMVPSFFPALTLLEQSDLIATVPRLVALTHAARFGLSVLPLPFDSPRFAVRAVWHRRDAGSQAHIWAVEMLEQAYASILREVEA